VSDTSTCDLCGTVNVGAPMRCIACGSPMRPASGAPEPLPEENDLDSAAGRATVFEEVPRRLVEAARTRDAEATAATEPEADAPSGTVTDAEMDEGLHYTVRLLLPDGDRRSIDVGSRKQPLGAGLDHLGVTGDPRVADLEGHLRVDGTDLIVEPVAGAVGIYRRLRGEEPLSPGDVVLMGDVAALFTTVPEAPPVDSTKRVLGGSANTPCGRLVFLRRDGTPGPLHDLPAGKTIVGRTDGHLNFPNDSRLSRRHARFFASDKQVTIEDLGSRNGTYVRIRGRSVLGVGDALRVGSAGLQVRERS